MQNFQEKEIIRIGSPEYSETIVMLIFPIAQNIAISVHVLR